MKKTICWINFLLFFLCNMSPFVANATNTNCENIQYYPFEGEWIISSGGYKKEKSWFAIKINAEKVDGHFKGTLIEKGTHNLNLDDSILSFHKVGDEYWGNFIIYSSPISCKIFLGTDKQKIEIITSHGAVYSGKKIVKSADVKTIDSIDQREFDANKAFASESSSNFNQEKVFSKNINVSDSSSQKSYAPADGYGEISKTTGRPKTKYVSGYYRKDGTYVKPYYRS